MTGSYDQNLSILSVVICCCMSTGYIRYFHGTDKRLIETSFYDGKICWSRDRFCNFTEQGKHESLADGTVNNVRLLKKDTTDEAGRQIWVMSVQVNWDHVKSGTAQ